MYKEHLKAIIYKSLNLTSLYIAAIVFQLALFADAIVRGNSDG